MAGKIVAYYRVSTAKQGRSGLGLEAQKEAVARHVSATSGRLVAELVEVESGRRDDRPKLQEALAICRLHRATLVIAKLDRLSRNAAFLLNLRDAGVKFVAADMPDANDMTIGILAVVAQHEREVISQRTKAALAAAKARDPNLKLGQQDDRNFSKRKEGSLKSAKIRMEKADDRAVCLAPIIKRMRKAGAVTLRELAEGLNAQDIEAPRGGKWSATQVMRVVQRMREA